MIYQLFTRPLLLLALLFGGMFFFGCGLTTLPVDLRGRAWTVAAWCLVCWCIWQITKLIAKITVEGRQ